MKKLTSILFIPVVILFLWFVSPGNHVLAQGLDREAVSMQNRVEEVVARILAKFEQRLNMYDEFLAKVQMKRNDLSKTSNVDEIDRLIRVAEINYSNTRNKLTAFKNSTNSLPEDNTNGENIALVMAGVRDVRQSFSELHTSVRNITREISRSSN